MNYNNPENTLEQVGYNKQLEMEEQEKKQKEIEMKNKQFDISNRKFERSLYNGNCYSWGFEHGTK